jgi:hypothetical protein
MTPRRRSQIWAGCPNLESGIPSRPAAGRRPPAVVRTYVPPASSWLRGGFAALTTRADRRPDRIHRRRRTPPSARLACWMDPEAGIGTKVSNEAPCQTVEACSLPDCPSRGQVQGVTPADAGSEPGVGAGVQDS